MIYLLALSLCASAHGQVADISGVIRSIGLRGEGFNCDGSALEQATLLVLTMLVTIQMLRLAVNRFGYTKPSSAISESYLVTSRYPKRTSGQASIWCDACGHRNTKYASVCAICPRNLRSGESCSSAEMAASLTALSLLEQGGPITEAESKIFLQQTIEHGSAQNRQQLEVENKVEQEAERATVAKIVKVRRNSAGLIRTVSKIRRKSMGADVRLSILKEPVLPVKVGTKAVLSQTAETAATKAPLKSKHPTNMHLEVHTLSQQATSSQLATPDQPTTSSSIASLSRRTKFSSQKPLTIPRCLQLDATATPLPTEEGQPMAACASGLTVEAATHRPERDSDYMNENLEDLKRRISEIDTKHLEAVQMEREMCATTPILLLDTDARLHTMPSVRLSGRWGLTNRETYCVPH